MAEFLAIALLAAFAYFIYRKMTKKDAAPAPNPNPDPAPAPEEPFRPSPRPFDDDVMVQPHSLEVVATAAPKKAAAKKKPAAKPRAPRKKKTD